MTQAELAPKGLAGVVVAETAISDVRGATGDLVYRGRSIRHWVEQPFAVAAAAVLDTQADVAALLFEHGALSERETALVLANKELHPMNMVQGLVPLLDSVALPGWGETAQGLVVAAKIPQLIATHLHGAAVAYPAEPDYVKRFLQQLPDQPLHGARAFSVLQILQLEHSLNAGTFAARVVASTLASVEAALAGALGALSGRLHGGADQAAMEMADSIATPAAADEFVTSALARGEKIMGIGHREYRVMDPRATYSKTLARELSAGTPHAATFVKLEAVERAVGAAMAARNKAVHPNLEFYKGLAYRCLGVPDRYFTTLFAMARVFGYIAHFAESRVDNRIIRPAARYIGAEAA